KDHPSQQRRVGSRGRLGDATAGRPLDRPRRRPVMDRTTDHAAAGDNSTTIGDEITLDPQTRELVDKMIRLGSAGIRKAIADIDAAVTAARAAGAQHFTVVKGGQGIEIGEADWLTDWFRSALTFVTTTKTRR